MRGKKWEEKVGKDEGFKQMEMQAKGSEEIKDDVFSANARYSGEPKIVYPSVYMNTCVGFKESTFLASYSLSLENSLTKRLQQATVDILKYLDSPPSHSFHVEVCQTSKKDLEFSAGRKL